MKRFFKLLSAVFIIALLLSLTAMAENVADFTVISEGADVQINENIVTLTYPAQTESVSLFFEGDLDTYCTLYADKEHTRPFTCGNDGCYNITLTQKYSNMYLEVTQGEQTDNYLLTVVSDRAGVVYADADKISNWAVPYIDYINRAGYGILVGDKDKKIHPTKQLSRYEMTVIAARMLGADLDSYADTALPYTDDIVSWAAPAVKAMTAMGVIDGNKVGDTVTFNGQNNITREQTAKIMVGILLLTSSNECSAAELYAQNQAAFDATLSAFADRADISDWALPYMSVAVGYFELMEGEKKGDAMYLAPKRNISRQEAATIIARQLGYDIVVTLQNLIDDVQQLLATTTKPAAATASLRTALDSATALLPQAEEPTDIPTNEDEIPTPKDEIPAPEDENPAPEDETPAPKDETPAPEDETPAPEDETSAEENEPSVFATANAAIDEAAAKAVHLELFKALGTFLGQKVVYLSPERRTTNVYTGVAANESDEMTAVAELMKPQLEALGYCVYIADRSVLISDRDEEAKALGADIYVAIHSNAAGKANDGSAQGCIIFHSNNPGSKELAECVSEYLCALTPTNDKGAKNDIDGIANPFIEVKEPEMANILAEVEFHDYAEYAQWIVNNKQGIAKAFVDGIYKYFTDYNF